MNTDKTKLKKIENRAYTGFWALAGSLKSNMKLTDKQLREARNKFEKEWAQNN